MLSSSHRRTRLAAALLMLAATACSDPLEITADFDTIESAVTVYAINDTPLALPTAVLIAPAPQAVRPGPEFIFDLAFDIVDGQAMLYPVDVVAGEGLLLGTRVTGIRMVADQTYDSIQRAPDGGYTVGEAVPIEVGDVGVLQSINHPSCRASFYSTNIFAKFRVEAIDPAARTATLRIRTDPNCGFRGLETGTPTR